MSSTQHQLIEQCATRLRGIVEALDNIHDNTPHRWSTDLDDVHSSAESLLAMIKDQAPPSEDQLIAAGLSYPLAKEDAVKLWYAGFRSEVVTVLEAWEAIGHDTGINPDKEELLESLRNMAAICNAHGNDMPAQSAIDQRQVIADAITGALAFGAQASQPPAADHWLRPFYDIGRAEGQRTQDLAMLVRMLASSLKRHAPESNLVARATNYLAAKGLAGTPLRDPPAPVEQACWDERKLSDLGNELHNLSCSIVHENEKLAEQIGGIARELWNWPQARAALAQPSPAIATAPTYQFHSREIGESDWAPCDFSWYLYCSKSPEMDTRVVEVTAQPSPAQAEQAEAERPEVFGLERYRVERTGQGFWPYCVRAGDGTRELFVGHLKQCKRVAAQLATAFEDGKFVAGALRAENAKLIEALDESDGDRWRLRSERDAALARVAELEKQEPVATVAKVPGEDWNSLDFHRELQDMHPGTKLYAAPVAQAQPEETPGEILAAKLIETWVTKHGKPAPWSTAVEITALATNMPNDERDRLLALDDDVDAQAQHSVPGNAAALVRAEGKKYSLNAAGMLDSGAPEHAQTFAIVQLLSEFDDEEAESHWEAIMAYSDFRTSDALFHAAELLAAAPGKSVPQAWLDVQAERRRQIEAEGWTPEHDDAHSHGQMARAAACYALAGSSAPNDGTAALLVSLAWPWDEQWWKPSTARRDMVKACALALAEIERLDRAAASQGGPSDA
ncbi:TPA: hypothetical protein ACKRKR_000258 [Pseudomonas aeruginosa]